MTDILTKDILIFIASQLVISNSHILSQTDINNEVEAQLISLINRLKTQKEAIEYGYPIPD